LLKKIIILGIIGAIILVGVAFSFSSSTVEENVEEKVDEQTMTITGDVVMPSKVSRPGCEEIDRCYIPSNIVIEKGKQVTWVNEDSAFHSVTSGFYETPTELFDSGHLDPYETYTLTFDESGTFDYFCTLHPWMKGQVIVE
jgi:plastocyanin